jgi:alginate O-acetyltransferase complex protein AlgJ
MDLEKFAPLHYSRARVAGWFNNRIASVSQRPGLALIPNAVLSTDGQSVFYASEHFGPVTEADVTSAIEALIKLRGELAKRGTRLLYVVVPEKQSIFGELYPSSAPAKTPLTLLHSYLTRLKEAGIDVVDLYAKYAQARTGDAPLYYRDDSHWTPYGVELAAEEISGVMGR